MSTYFISDLHLQACVAKNCQIFLRFLKQEARDADALYILGDLFEAWIGDDDNTDFAKTIKTALKELTASGVTVYFMRGNRDFIIGERFANETGIHLLHDPSIVDIYGQRILLMHGDLLCSDDEKYQAFRRKAYEPKFQARMRRLPLWLRRLVAAWARYKSKKHTKQTDLTIQDVNQDTVLQYLDVYQTTMLIHGHTHRPALHTFTHNGQTMQRIVLDTWHQHGHALKIDAQGKLENLELQASL